MNWFKSVWLKLRKSTGLPGNTVLIPMAEQKIPEVIETKPKPKRIVVRKKKDANNT